MLSTEFYAIAERNLDIQNPISAQKLGLLSDYCGIGDAIRILDIGCGRGWLLRSWASRWSIDGTGLELNPSFHDHACQQVEACGLGDRLRFVRGPALDFTPEPASYDVVLCIGATFALGGLEPAVSWMRRASKANGVMAIGEVFAAEKPFPPQGRDEEPMDLVSTIDFFDRAGLEVTAMLPASHDDWDYYESQHWHAVHEWAVANPDHPLRAQVLDRIRTARAAYFAWERRYFGWGIFVLRPRLS